MITITECKNQCNLLDEEVEYDRWFNMAIPAAVALVEKSLDRKLYDSSESLEADTDAPPYSLVITEDLRMATLMLLGHWFINRESVSALTLNDTPMAFTAIIQSHRNIGL